MDVPEGSPQHPHRSTYGRATALHGMHSHRVVSLIRTGSVLLCLDLFLSAGVAAASSGPLPPSTIPTTAPTLHLTDEQDRMMTGQLSPELEARSHANALYAKAISTDSTGKSQEAFNQLRQVAALDPHFVDAQVKIANFLLQGGHSESALEQLKSATAANPDSCDIEAALGYTQHLRGQNDEAFRLSSEALTKNADQAMAMQVLLEIAGDRDDLAGGVAHIEDILKAHAPDVSASTWLTLGRLYLEVARGDAHTPTGETLLKTLLGMQQQAAAKSPPEVSTLTLLADTYRNLGQKNDALKTLQEAAALEPSNVDLILRCADLETDLGQKTEALKDYEEAYGLNPNLVGLREMLGRLYLDNAKFTDAARLLEETIAHSPDDPGLEIDLGVAYEESHQHGKAQAAFQQAFNSPACPPEAYLKLTVFQLSTHRIKEAGETLIAAEGRFPQSAKIQFYKAIQYRYAKNYLAALTCLQEVQALAPSSDTNVFDLNYYLESALIFNLANRKDLIEPTLHEGLARYPDNPDLMNELAYFWADQGSHLSEALALCRHAAQLDSESGPIQDTCGWVYYRLGQAKEALPYLQRAALLTNNDPVVLQHLGDTYLKLGRKREAIVAWRTALGKDPGNHELTHRIDANLAQANNAHLRYAPNK